MLYERFGNDIWSIKKQQWHISYYSLVAHAVLVGFVSIRASDIGLTIRDLYLAERAVMLVLSLGVFVFALAFFYRSQLHLAEYLLQQDRVGDLLSDALGFSNDSKHPAHVLPPKGIFLTSGMVLALISVTGLYSWLLFGSLVCTGVIVAAIFACAAISFARLPRSLQLPDRNR